MKKLVTLLFIISGIAVYAQENSSWDDWQKTSCYSKISYRMKTEEKHGEQFHWKLQFRNDYGEVISFNYHVTDKLQEYNITTHRKTMNAGKISEEIDIYTRESDIFLLVDKASLSPYPDIFLECDN